MATHGGMGSRSKHGATVGERRFATNARHASNADAMRLDIALQRQLAGNTRNHVVGFAQRGRIDANRAVDDGRTHFRVGADLDDGRARG